MKREYRFWSSSDNTYHALEAGTETGTPQVTHCPHGGPQADDIVDTG